MDFNYDQKIKIVIAGDSVVQGVGDAAHGDFGGYPLRLEEMLPGAQVINDGEEIFSLGSDPLAP